MKKYNRIFMVVTDSLGIGEDPREEEFKDKGANTLYHVSQTGMLNIPNWTKMGIGSIAKVDGIDKVDSQIAYTARMNELSNAKDTLAGHWEMMGLKTTKPFPVFTDTGFPQDLLDKLSKDVFEGRKIVGNKSASGTEIINELASEERDNNAVIVYTSSDSVLQICGHEEWMGIDKLWEYGVKAREVCSSKPEWNVGRIIVRPYIGEEGSYSRTYNRRDYGVTPPGHLLTKDLQNKGTKVTAIGKINDILVGVGIDEVIKTKGDEDGLNKTLDIIKSDSSNQFIFVNLVDFDASFGHRRDPEGYAKNINLLDQKLSEIMNELKEDDLFIMTSDHGNDPTFPGSDHTREHVPVTIYAKNFEGTPKALSTFEGFGTLGNLVAKNFDIPLVDTGEDRSNEII